MLGCGVFVYMTIVNFKYIWFKVPQKLLRKLYNSHRVLDKKTYQKMLYYREVLEGVANKTQHLISIIDRILLKG